MTELELNNYRNIINDPRKMALEVEGLVTKMLSGDDVPAVQHTNCSGKSCQNCPDKVKCVSRV